MKMKHFSSVFFLALLLLVQPSQATQDSYIDLSKERSNLAAIVADISSWDENKNSLICQLNAHINDGYAIAFKDAVLEALTYAELVVAKKSKQLSHDQLARMNNALNMLADTINNGDLSVVVNDEDISRGETIKVKNKTKFLKDVTFKDEVEFEDKADFKHFVGFHGNVHFWKNVEIDGTLSVTDLVVADCINNLCVNNLTVTDLTVTNCISDLCIINSSVNNQIIACDLSVGCNISMVDSIDADHGNIIKNGVPFMQTFPAGSNNTFVGSNAGGTFTATGANNTGFGSGVMLVNTTGNSNTSIGANALNNNISGDGNVALGFNAGTTLLTGNNNIYIASEGAPAESGTIRIGTDLVHTITVVQGIFGGAVTVGNMPVLVDLNGHLGTVPSGRRFKQNISDMAIESEGIYSLRPVTFSYKSDPSNTKEYGLIAEEVAEIFPSLIAHDRDGNIYSVRYQVLPMLLLNEVQKQHASIEALTARVDQLEERA